MTQLMLRIFQSTSAIKCISLSSFNNYNSKIYNCNPFFDDRIKTYFLPIFYFDTGNRLQLLVVDSRAEISVIVF